jgi:hypothetical protein
MTPTATVAIVPAAAFCVASRWGVKCLRFISMCRQDGDPQLTLR